MIMTALTIFPFIGESTVAYNYVRSRYEWEITDYAHYKTIVSASTIAGKYRE